GAGLLHRRVRGARRAAGRRPGAGPPGRAGRAGAPRPGRLPAPSRGRRRRPRRDHRGCAVIVTDAARAPGALAERLTAEEAAALHQAAALASIRLTEQARLGSGADDLAREARALASAVRKLDALMRGGGLEVRTTGGAR